MTVPSIRHLVTYDQNTANGAAEVLIDNTNGRASLDRTDMKGRRLLKSWWNQSENFEQNEYALTTNSTEIPNRFLKVLFQGTLPPSSGTACQSNVMSQCGFKRFTPLYSIEGKLSEKNSLTRMKNWRQFINIFRGIFLETQFFSVEFLWVW